jgi:hypothetical protein
LHHRTFKDLLIHPEYRLNKKRTFITLLNWKNTGRITARKGINAIVNLYYNVLSCGDVNGRILSDLFHDGVCDGEIIGCLCDAGNAFCLNESYDFLPEQVYQVKTLVHCLQGIH